MIWAENHSCRITLYSSVQIGTGRKRHDFIDRHSQLFFETANAARIRHLEENGGFAERMRKLRKQNQIIGKLASVSHALSPSQYETIPNQPLLFLSGSGCFFLIVCYIQKKHIFFKYRQWLT